MNSFSIKQIKDNTQKTVYKQQCHEHCYLKGIPTETVNNAALQSCAAFNGEDHCQRCHHSWRVHMHMTYDMEKETVRVINKHKESLLNKEKGHATKLADFINRVQVYVEELKKEQTQITNICAQFGCYLKKNAITPFNDEIDAHLQMLIKQEKNKPGSNQNTIENFERMRQKYEQKKKIIYKAMEQPDASNEDFISEPGKVDELKKKLFCLKHNGASLNKIFMEIKKARNEYRYNEMQVAPVNRASSQRSGLLSGLKNAFKSTGRKIGSLFGSF